MSLAKFSGADLDASVEFAHPNIWSRDVHPGWQRLKIGAREGEISLILEMCREMRGPFGVLYVLLVSRQGNPSGRYQCPQPVSYDDLELFLYTFQEFLEQDGRHHLWVTSVSGEGQFIFDQHNLIYAYGDLSAYEGVLRRHGFREGVLASPEPHAHHFHREHDLSEADLMGYWDWKRFPLAEGDDP